MPITPLASITPRHRPEHGGPGADDPLWPRTTLSGQEARRGDGRRETLRVLDVSLMLAAIALVVLAIFFAALAAA